jgi:PmbA protein
MNPEDTIKKIIRGGLKHGASDIASALIRSTSKMVRFSNNEITVTNLEESDVINTFVSVKGKTAIGSLENLDAKATETYVAKLLETAKLMKLNKDYTPLPNGPFEYSKKVPFFDSNIGGFDEELVDYTEASINAALEEGAERTAGALITRSFEIWLNTSGGVEASEKGSSIELSLRAFAADGASGNGISCSRTIKDFDPENAGRRAGRIAVLSKKPIEVDAGKYRVVLGPYIFANLLNEVANSASAFSVDAGLSFFPRELLGDKVASEKMTVYDDGIIPEGLNSRIFDDEGVPTQRTALIDRGVLKSLIHNSMTAKKYKTKTTGNAGWIAPEPWNIVVEAGDIKEDGMLSAIESGLYITNTWYTRFQDYRKGDFSTVCRDGAFKVENGEIVSSVKNLRISDNMINVMKNVEELSRERQWVKWWEVPIPTLLPTAIVREIGITRTTK